MDEFKRTYSNNDTATVALPYFWKNYEKEFYSLWYCEYKYASELTQLFMSCNLITGKRFEQTNKQTTTSIHRETAMIRNLGHLSTIHETTSKKFMRY